MNLALPDLTGRLRSCQGVLVDSNILLDVATNDPAWGNWSARVLSEAAEHATLLINPIVYAEISVGFATIEILSRAFPREIYRREPLP